MLKSGQSENAMFNSPSIPVTQTKEKQIIKISFEKITQLVKSKPWWTGWSAWKKDSQDTSHLENQIDQLVYQLYDLIPEEIEVVEG